MNSGNQSVAEDDPELCTTFEKLLEKVANKLGNVEEKDFDDELTVCLQTFGEFLEFDRSTVMLFSEHGRQLTVTHCWAREGIAHVAKDTKINETSWYAHQIRSGHIVRIAKIGDLPEEAREEQGFMEESGLKSTISIPLISEEAVIGVMSFGTFYVERPWPDGIVTRLRLAGEIVTLGMRRHQYAEGLQTIMQTANRLAAPRMEIGRKRTEHMRRLAVELMQVEHDERRRISEVIHEDVMQTLAAINMNLESAHKEDDAVHLSATLSQTKKMMQDALAKLRGLTIDLRSEKLSEKGLTEGLRFLVEQMRQTRDLSVELRSDNTIEPLSIEAQVFLYNAARKLLDNVAAHSHTNRARLEVQRIDEQHVRLIVSDEGVGFIVGRLDVIPSRSFGLSSIREQAELLGGHLDVDSSPGHGMRVVLTVSA